MASSIGKYAKHPLAATILLVPVTLLIALSGQAATSVSIDGKCNIYGAGHLVPPGPGGSVGGGDGGGILPVEVTLSTGVGRVVTFDLAGTIDYGGCCPTYGPDGKDFVGLVPHSVYGGIAGCDLPVRAYYLAGVFLNDSEPVDPGPGNLTIPDITFTYLAPGIGQVFFVGDGRVGTGSGNFQTFAVPDGATRLFLGYQDRCSVSPNLPGCYDDNSGTVTGLVVGQVSPVPMPATAASYTMDQNVPNPFNPLTTIGFEIPTRQAVTVQVFDLSGRLVRNLIADEEYAPGRHEVVWNGRNGSGRQVASGTYFYRLEAGSYSETKRMVLIK